ncbi:thioredoxin family protein [Mesomycoplasma bovoculi]|uniref:Putative thioredoxin n=1 Tax=Mesomycoplasma bovoculi M165/69 TaxID=743966 RepID=W5USB8_9BACT|nr:thioredoxin family protein [Mesomycoplasma bovoculi]AHH45119.1 putative thioredoxin [Mesomycoplasma bovoculi M165/69]
MKLLKWEDAQKEIETGVVYLEFAVDWCGDCKMQEPINQQVAEHYKGRDDVKLIKVNAEEAGLFRKPGTRFEVLYVPTHLVLKDGEILFKKFEYAPKEMLIKNIDAALAK